MVNDLLLKNFRNYENFYIKFSNKVNSFVGINGAGKTNILEAIYFSSLLRSFRTAALKDLAKIGSDGFYISSNLNTGKGWNQLIEIDYRGERHLKIDGELIRKGSEFIGKMNVVVFAPNDIKIVTDGSPLRRRFINMILSSTFPSYLNALNDYNRALKSRNILLKNRSVGGEIEAFEQILAEKGVYILNYRKQFLNKLSDEMLIILQRIRSDVDQFRIRYITHSETVDKDSYLLKFNKDSEKDIARGYTTFGPHVDDFDFVMNSKSLRHFGSTGQCRITSLCLKMATVAIIDREKSIDSKIVTLVDDVTGDLDANTKNAFFEVIDKSEQTFFTFTEKPKDLFFENSENFNISNGKIV